MPYALFALYGIVSAGILVRLEVRLGHLLFIPLLVLSTTSMSFVLADMELPTVDAVFLLLCGLYLCISLYWRNRVFTATPIDGYAVAFLLVNVVIIGISVQNGNILLNAVREFLTYFRIFLATILFVNMLNTERELETLVIAALALCAVACMYGIYQHFTYRDFIGDETFDVGVRIPSFFNNPNTYGGYLQLMYFLSLSCFFTVSARPELHRFRWLVLLLIGLIALNIIYTYSRGPLLCAIATTMLYLWQRGHRRLFMWLTGSALAVVIGAGALMFELLSRQLSMFADFQAFLLEYTILHRIAQYLHYISIICDNTLTGLGWGVMSINTFAVDFVPTTQVLRSFGALNSVYFDLAVKSGVVSLAVFVAAFVALLRHIQRHREAIPGTFVHAAADGLTYGLISLAVHQTMDNMLKWSQIGFLVALLAAIVLKGIAIGTGREKCYELT